MKTKEFCVTYNYRVYSDAKVTARTIKEAEAKVLEVLGDVQLAGTWEVRSEKKTKS